jgi:hypothetical protein
MVVITTWIMSVLSAISEFIFSNLLQRLYDRLTGNGTPDSPRIPKRRSGTNEWKGHIRAPEHTPWSRLLIHAIIGMLVMDRGRLWVQNYANQLDDMAWAHDQLKTCDGKSPYAGRMHAQNCAYALRVDGSSALWTATMQTLNDTRMCIWWDCTDLTYIIITSMPVYMGVMLVAVAFFFLCTDRGHNGPHAITFVPSFQPPSVASADTTPNDRISASEISH